MGNLLKVLARDGEACFKNQNVDVFVDFESAQPHEDEAEIYYEAEKVLKDSELILEKLKSYKGAPGEIKEALMRPSCESERKAWDAIVPLVFKLKEFYQFSTVLEDLVPKIFSKLCEARPLSQCNIAEQLDEHQALVKQFAKLLEFVLIFDELKMQNPAMQNDFSYFRRTSQRLKNNPTSRLSCPPKIDNNFLVTTIRSSYEDIEDAIPVEMTYQVSNFLAHATPMLQIMSNAMAKFVKAQVDPNVDKMTTDILSMMAKVCQKMLDLPDLKARIQHEKTQLFILRVMVGIIILFDHVHAKGAFAKGSPVDIKGCVRIVREQDKTVSDNLMNALRYTTRHLNEESTPKQIKTLFAFNV